MKINKYIIGGIIILTLVSIVLLGNGITWKVIDQESIMLGYCPTMFPEAQKLSLERDFVLKEYNSAAEVLNALRNNQINKALIGRKAKSYEINSNIKENILEGGYTLVSNQRGFIDYVELNSLEIYTYLENNTLNLKKNLSKEEVLEKIKDGKIALIPWKDWNDDFELVVVMNGNEKVKDFRGVFLYET